MDRDEIRSGDWLAIAEATPRRLAALFAGWPLHARRDADEQLSELLSPTGPAPAWIRRARGCVIVREPESGREVSLRVPLGC